ncbi:cytochrome AA3 biosynthesis protein [Halobacteriales archaeon SW_10_68_16]|jgi:cytochrome c oxidase assembly protein subunit 15|nr:MAG: cytochrome AA3 biosynthesis protein [Halobacteriales archaeon SW_10_68_16]
MNLSFRHLAATTTGFTFGLIVLGVYTGAIGADLACAAAWPFCDGWLGLFPATWPSFVEWFHRFVALVTGLLIAGMAVAAWRGGYDRRIRYASGVALVFLPIQVVLGATTVLGFVPVSPPVTQTLHHATAKLIFGALVVATTLSYALPDDGRTATTDGTTTRTAAGADD